MSLEVEGFFIKSLEDRLNDIKDRILEEIPYVDFGPGEWLYQLAKIMALREDDIQIEMQMLVDNLSPATSYGVYLHSHAANHGLRPGSGTPAVGRVLVQGPAGTMLPPATSFDSDGTYFTTEEGWIAPLILLKKGVDNTTPIPFPRYVTWAESIHNETTDVNYNPGTDYYIENNRIVWLTIPANDDVLLLDCGESGGVIVAVRSLVASMDGNRASGITLTPENPQLTVTSYTEIVGGTDVEAPEELRARVQSARYRTRNRAAMESIIADIDGIDKVRIEHVMGDDWASPHDWSDGVPDQVTGSLTGYLSGSASGWACITQSFDVSPGISAISGIDLVLRKPTEQHVGAIEVEILDSIDNVLGSKIITQTDLDYTVGTGQQTVFVDIPLAPVYSTATYHVRVSTIDGWIVGYSDIEDGNERLYVVDEDGNTIGDHGTHSLTSRIRWKSASYNINVLPEAGYGMEITRALVNNKMSTEESGFGVLGVGYIINEVGKDYISIGLDGDELVVYTKRGFIFAAVAGAIADSLTRYLSEFEISENIPYTGILGAIMQVPGVREVTNVNIYKNTIPATDEDTRRAVRIENGRLAVPATPVVKLIHGNP